jgi:predicted PurR-regulated permease PerM
MPLTLNQFLFLVITIAIIVIATYLVIFLAQLRKTVKEGQDTLAEAKKLMRSVSETSQKVNSKIDDMTPMVEASKQIAVSISKIALFLATKVLKPSSKYWPLVFPILRSGWRQIKKKKKQKEDKNGV